MVLRRIFEGAVAARGEISLVVGFAPPGEEATVRIDWVIPATTDNVIQSDGVNVAVTFELRAPEDGS